MGSQKAQPFLQHLCQTKAWRQHHPRLSMLKLTPHHGTPTMAHFQPPGDYTWYIITYRLIITFDNCESWSDPEDSSLHKKGKGRCNLAMGLWLGISGLRSRGSQLVTSCYYNIYYYIISYDVLLCYTILYYLNDIIYMHMCVYTYIYIYIYTYTYIYIYIHIPMFSFVPSISSIHWSRNSCSRVQMTCLQVSQHFA